MPEDEEVPRTKVVPVAMLQVASYIMGNTQSLK